MAQDPSREEENWTRQRKRRKTDCHCSTPHEESPKPIEYGEFGQVKPGRLRMLLVSSDGGTFVPDVGYPYIHCGHSPHHGAENILKEDNSVYSTKGPQCNIVLAHEGLVHFNVTKIVVQAPTCDYSDPVQEGLVFLHTDKDEAFERTAQYQIHHFPTSRFGPNFNQDTGSGSGSDHAKDTGEGVRIHYACMPHHRDCTSPPPPYSASRHPGAPPQPQRRRSVILPATDTSDSGDDDHESPDPDPQTLREILQSARRTPDGEDSSEEPTESILAQIDFDDVLHRGSIAADRRRSRLTGSSLAEAVLGLESRAQRTTSNPANIHNDYLDPVAHFSFPRTARCSRNRLGTDTSPRGRLYGESGRDQGTDRAGASNEHQAARVLSRVRALARGEPQSGDRDASNGPSTSRDFEKDDKMTIEFDPPRSVRYILLKLWNPRGRNRTIDIERLEVHGFCGIRWMPSVEFR